MYKKYYQKILLEEYKAVIKEKKIKNVINEKLKIYFLIIKLMNLMNLIEIKIFWLNRVNRSNRDLSLIMHDKTEHTILASD